jgi:hypothetical protein
VLIVIRDLLRKYAKLACRRDIYYASICALDSAAGTDRKEDRQRAVRSGIPSLEQSMPSIAGVTSNHPVSNLRTRASLGSKEP